jgi:hypothetical protein
MAISVLQEVGLQEPPRNTSQSDWDFLIDPLRLFEGLRSLVATLVENLGAAESMAVAEAVWAILGAGMEEAQLEDF